ncbi:MAG: DUF11 domain-containing protein, partial [Caldiserica bacterium]|nr:DUF11 domain-containing protein [Caldisericota bacterium]
MKKMPLILGILLIVAGATCQLAAQSETFVLDYTEGIWIDADDSPTGLGTSEIRWGQTSGQRSGYEFFGSTRQTFGPDEEFLIGEFWHYNWPVSPPTITWAQLRITLHFTNPPISPDPTFTYVFQHDETPNDRDSCSECEYSPCSRPCPDRVTFPDAYAEESYRIGDKLYTLKILGFKDSYPGGNPVSEFITQEQENNRAYLVGVMTSVLVAEPQIRVVEKYVSPDGVTWYEADNPPGPTVAAGATVYWKYIVQNTGNVTLTDVTVFDDKLGVVGTVAQLAPGDTATFYAQDTAIEGQYTNTATAEGYYNGTRYADDVGDPAHYQGVSPCPNYTVTYLGRTTSGGTTTFTYRVSVADDPALSHWVLGLPECITADDIVSAGPGWDGTVHTDPTTGVRGIKFEVSIDPGMSETFTVTVRGTALEQDVEYGLKAGTVICKGTTKGPSCPVLEADLEVRKTCHDLVAGASGQLAYTIVVTNHGPNEATNVVLTDTLPSGLSNATYEV